MLNILKNLKRKRKKKNSFVHRGTVITIGVIAAVKSKEKKICLKIKNINDVLMMKMWNTSTRIPDVKRGKFVTDKLEAEGHGWGIESVKRLVKRYDGNITFKYDSNFFQVTIILSKN